MRSPSYPQCWADPAVCSTMAPTEHLQCVTEIESSTYRICNFHKAHFYRREKKAKHTILFPLGMAFSRARVVHSCTEDRKEIFLPCSRIYMLLIHYEKDLWFDKLFPLCKRNHSFLLKEEEWGEAFSVLFIEWATCRKIWIIFGEKNNGTWISEHVLLCYSIWLIGKDKVEVQGKYESVISLCTVTNKMSLSSTGLN